MPQEKRQIQGQRRFQRQQPSRDYLTLGGKQGISVDNGLMRMKFRDGNGRPTRFFKMVDTKTQTVRLVSPGLELGLHAHAIEVKSVKRCEGKGWTTNMVWDEENKEMVEMCAMCETIFDPHSDKSRWVYAPPHLRRVNGYKPVGCLVLSGIHHTVIPFLNMPDLRTDIGLLPRKR